MKKKYITVFVVKENNSYSILRKKKISPSTERVRYKAGKSYKVNISVPTYSKGLKNFYFIDEKKGQLSFLELYKDANPEAMDLIFEQGILRNIISGLMARVSSNILMVIMALSLGVAVGFIARGFL